MYYYIEKYEKGANIRMKKVIIAVLCMLVMLFMPICYAQNATNIQNNTEKQGTEALVEIKENVQKKLEEDRKSVV